MWWTCKSCHLLNITQECWCVWMQMCRITACTALPQNLQCRSTPLQMPCGATGGVMLHHLSGLIGRAMLSLLVYHRTDEISSRKLCNRAFHLSDAENSPITEKEFSGGGKKIMSEKKTTSKNGSGQGGGKTHTNNNSDYKLRSVAERWQDFLKEPQSTAVSNREESGACSDWKRTKGRRSALLTPPANTNSFSERRQWGKEDDGLHAMFSFHTSSRLSGWGGFAPHDPSIFVHTANISPNL